MNNYSNRFRKEDVVESMGARPPSNLRIINLESAVQEIVPEKNLNIGNYNH